MNQAEHLQSRILREAGFRHAFFTRRGGVSTGPYRSLNFSAAVGDSQELVAQNLRLGAEALGVVAERVYFLSQVHGSDVVVLNGDEDRLEVLHRKGDALLAQRSTLACGVRTADCVPILIADRRTGAAGAIHAGWRGVQAWIVRSAVERLRSLIGGDGDIVAAIGPHISLEAFEVGSEVADRLQRASPDADVVDRSLGPRPHVALGRIVRAQLRSLGLADDQIDLVPGCTLKDEQLFFSYRRDGKVGGRHLHAIVPREG